jgi:hypothetical protein
MALKQRKPADPTTARVLALAGGTGLVMLAAIGITLYFTLIRTGKVDLGAVSTGGLFDLPNAKVTEDNYIALIDGMTPAEVEAILGNGGQAPTSGDFDTIFGEKREYSRLPSQQQRETWEENNGRGLVRHWAKGPERIMVTYTRKPDDGGRLIAKLFRRTDGSFGMSYGSGQPPREPPPSTNQPPKNTEPKTQPKGNPNTSPQASAAEWEQLVGTWEVVGDPRLRVRFGADKKMGDIFLVNGKQTREKIYTVREVRVENGRIAPQLDLGTVNGQPNVTAALGVFWFENGTLLRDPGNGKPQQTLKRVE